MRFETGWESLAEPEFQRFASSLIPDLKSRFSVGSTAAEAEKNFQGNCRE